MVGNVVIPLLRATKAWIRHRVLMSRVYDRVMRSVRGYGGFTGSDRKGYPFASYFAQERQRYLAGKEMSADEYRRVVSKMIRTND